MIKIRHGFFETNSSSTHAIILGGNIQNQRLNRIGTGQYWWDDDSLGWPESKASYIYTLFCTQYPEYKEKFFQRMEELTGQSRDEMFEPHSDEDFAYIDHGDEYNPEEILLKLEQIIFGNGDIIMGNDNSDEGINIPEGAEYIHKGN